MKESVKVILFLVSMIVFVNVSVLCIATILLWTLQSDDDGDNHDFHSMCLPCSTKSYDNTCCETHKQYLSHIYEDAKTAVYLDDEHNSRGETIEKRKNEPYMYIKPVARLTGDRENDSIPTHQGMKSLRSWRTGNNCYLSNGVSLRNGRFVIPLAGLYYVYVSLKVSHPQQKYKRVKRSSVIEVVRYNIMSGEEILVSSMSPPRRSATHLSDVQTLYIGADIGLKQADEIYIKVNENFISHNPSANVFGLYML